MAGDTGRERKNNRETGSYYERLAGAYLEQEGYEILEYNYRCKTGEIDIIAREAGYLVFCEVKYRTSDKKWTSGGGCKSSQTENHFQKCTLLYDGQRNR